MEGGATGGVEPSHRGSGGCAPSEVQRAEPQLMGLGVKPSRS